MSQTLLSFEQAAVDAEQAAKDAAAKAKADAKRQAELDKLSRRLARDAAARGRRPDESSD